MEKVSGCVEHTKALTEMLQYLPKRMETLLWQHGLIYKILMEP